MGSKQKNLHYNLSIASPEAKTFIHVINQGIDGHLEAFTKSQFKNIAHRLDLTFDASEVHILVRRLTALNTEKSRLLVSQIEAGRELSDFVKAYLEAALWSSVDGSDESGGEPFDSNYSLDDISTESLELAIKDCADFQSKAGSLLDEMSDERAGHDFWLTRNRHGAGFWDRGLGDTGEQLTKLAQSYGELSPILGSDSKVWITL